MAVRLLRGNTLGTRKKKEKAFCRRELFDFSSPLPLHQERALGASSFY